MTGLKPVRGCRIGFLTSSFRDVGYEWDCLLALFVRKSVLMKILIDEVNAKLMKISQDLRING